MLIVWWGLVMSPTHNDISTHVKWIYAIWLKYLEETQKKSNLKPPIYRIAFQQVPPPAKKKPLPETSEAYSEGPNPGLPECLPHYPLYEASTWPFTAIGWKLIPPNVWPGLTRTLTTCGLDTTVLYPGRLLDYFLHFDNRRIRPNPCNPADRRQETQPLRRIPAR